MFPCSTGIFICQKIAFTSTLFLRQKKICKSTISFVYFFLLPTFILTQKHNIICDERWCQVSSLFFQRRREDVERSNSINQSNHCSTFNLSRFNLFKGYNMRPKINDDNSYEVEARAVYEKIKRKMKTHSIFSNILLQVLLYQETSKFFLKYILLIHIFGNSNRCGSFFIFFIFCRSFVRQDLFILFFSGQDFFAG